MTDRGLVTAAHCIALIRAFVIVENVKPSLKHDGEVLFLDLSNARLGETLAQDFAVIPLPFEHLNYFEIADSCQPQYIFDETSEKGESGKGLLNESEKICGVLSKFQEGKTIYAGLSLRTLSP